MKGYPHGQHSYQETGTKYRHSPEALSAAKYTYHNEYQCPHDNYADDVFVEHMMLLSLFNKGTLFFDGQRSPPLKI
jgi:hypothetical protein